MYEKLTHIARVVKPHGKRGEVVVVPKGALPPLMRSGLEVWIVPPELKGDRHHTVLSVSDTEAGQLVSFDQMENRNDAEALIGRHILVRESDLPQDFELMDSTSYLGFQVVDKNMGLLGQLVDVMASPAQQLMVVESETTRAMIPVVPEFVLDVDVDAQTIEVEVLEGLVESK